MTDFKPQTDPNEPPEDVATLYSWANLHGAKYRDFSAARAETREKARLRAEQALIDEHFLNRPAEPAPIDAPEPLALAAQIPALQSTLEEAQAEAEQAAREAETAEKQAKKRAQAEAQLAAEEAAARHEAELAAQQATELAAQRAAEEFARRTEQEASEAAARQAEHEAEQRAFKQAQEEAAIRMERQAAEVKAAEIKAAELATAAKIAAEEAAAAQRIAWQPPQPEGFKTPVTAHLPSAAGPRAERLVYPGTSQQESWQRAFDPYQARPHSSQARQENEMPPINPWATQEAQEPAGRPAWLNPEPAEPAVSSAPRSAPLPPEDTLQGSRDRLTSRWFALRGIFDGSQPLPEAAPPPAVSQAPAMGIFSLAGGVGKTSLAATLGRALAARGERVLLVDTAAFGLLPFFFGATDQRPGVLRTFSHPGVSSDAPIQLVTIDPDGLNGDTTNQESLSGEIQKFSRGASRVIVDLATASGATTRRILRMSPLVLVPVVPDMNSVVSVSSIDAFFERNGNPSGRASMPFYLLNQFDASLPLHLDVREVLREQLGERLLPFVLRRSPAMSEALAEGMTVMDYAPASPLAEDYATLSAWVKNVSAPATVSYRGVRWSEQ